MKGWIALDVDGTLTQERYSLPLEVMNYLGKLEKDGWQLIFLTGRSFSFAKEALKKLTFPYLFALQNGSLVLKMPSKEILLKNYIEKSVIALVEKSCEDLEILLLIYAGMENNDVCFWKKTVATPLFEQYLKTFISTQGQSGNLVKEFPVSSTPLIKCVGSFDQMVILEERLCHNDLIQTSLIKDPFDERFCLLLITNKGVSKGQILKKITSAKKPKELIIAAGNDDNDLSMFDVADIKIAMPSSPKHMLIKADFVAPPVEEMGIISALQHVLAKPK